MRQEMRNTLYAIGSHGDTRNARTVARTAVTKTNSRVKRELVPSSPRHSLKRLFISIRKLENNNTSRKLAEASLWNVYGTLRSLT